MSRSELIDAYVSGRIGRREFIHGLVALGASTSAAAAHAVALRPAAAHHFDDEYFDDYYGHPKNFSQCQDGKYKKLGFKNRRQCIRSVRRRNRRRDRRRNRR